MEGGGCWTEIGIILPRITEGERIFAWTHQIWDDRRVVLVMIQGMIDAEKADCNDHVHRNFVFSLG